MDKRKQKSKSKKKSGTSKKHQIIDLTQYRKNKNEQRMREYERILFNRILGVYSFAEKKGLHHVEVIDISFSGLKFRELAPEEPCKIGDRLALRFYFTPSSYLRLVTEVKRVVPFHEKDRDGIECGCTVDKDTRSYAVLKTLVQFMQQYSEVACQDDHPPLIWF